MIKDGKWSLTDPMGGRYELEKVEGKWGRTDGVHPWILQELEQGRTGRVYGWGVKLEC